MPSFVEISPPVLEKKIFEGFLPIKINSNASFQLQSTAKIVMAKWGKKQDFYEAKVIAETETCKLYFYNFFLITCKTIIVN